MKHLIIMPEDCYKATSGRYADCIVRKSRMGVEMLATHSEVRYIVPNISAEGIISDISPETIEQAWKFHTCDAIISEGEGADFPVKLSYVPKSQKFKIEEYA